MNVGATEADDGPSDGMERLEVADQALARNLAWIAAADAKAPTVLAIDYAMLAVLATLIPNLAMVQTTALIAAAIAGAMLLASVGYLSAVVFPHFTGLKRTSIFFVTAAAQSEQEYVQRVASGPTTELIEDIATQAYRNAVIAKSKYRNLRSAMLLLFLSTVPWITAIALLYK